MFFFFIMIIFNDFSPPRWKCPRFSFQNCGHLSFGCCPVQSTADRYGAPCRQGVQRSLKSLRSARTCGLTWNWTSENLTRRLLQRFGPKLKQPELMGRTSVTWLHHEGIPTWFKVGYQNTVLVLYIIWADWSGNPCAHLSWGDRDVRRERRKRSGIKENR